MRCFRKTLTFADASIGAHQNDESKVECATRLGMKFLIEKTVAGLWQET